ncbi:hypothetical protein FOZ62_021613 [Perkinsus olseni]|uniref:Uncharacterized protein n=2 Tax=Perkinsus olseni TaxID=32597 RepID=A0A7J6T3V0_PEROL|nr:hypothetical protein FOZ62_021613 [Perkinsus olseni]
MAIIQTLLISALLLASANGQLPGLYTTDAAPGFFAAIKINEDRSLTVIYRCSVNDDTNLYAGPYGLSRVSLSGENSIVGDVPAEIRQRCPHVGLVDGDFHILHFEASRLTVPIEGEARVLSRRYAAPKHGYRTQELDIELKILDGVQGTMTFICGANKASRISAHLDYNYDESKYEVKELSKWEVLRDNLQRSCGINLSTDDCRTVVFNTPTTAVTQFRVKLTDFLALQKQVGALTAALASKQDRVIFKETDGTETSITDYLTKVGQRVNTMEQGLIAVTNEVKAMESWDGSLDSKIDSQSHLLRSIAEAVQAKPLAVSSRSLPQQSADPVCEVVMSPTINLSYIWVLCSLDYMVENSLADSAENLPPAVVKVCALLGVKDSTLLRFLPDAEIDKYCSKFVGDGAAATTSSDFGAVSFASGDDHTVDEVPTMSRMLQIVKSIKLPNERTQ